MSLSKANTREVIDANKIITEIPLFPSHWILKEVFGPEAKYAGD